MPMQHIENEATRLHIGREIKRRRLIMRYSLEELGRRIGVTYQQVQKYETGANRVSADTLFRLAEVLETPVSAFYPQEAAVPVSKAADDVARLMGGLDQDDQKAIVAMVKGFRQSRSVKEAA